MARLNLKAVEERVRPLAGRQSYDRGFVFELLAAYGRSQGNITRLKNGSLNVSEHPETEVVQKGVVYFAATADEPLVIADTLRTSPAVVRYGTRFVIATDFTTLVAVDTKTAETLVAPIAEIDQHFTFFLPWAGMEKAQYVAEAHADVKAAERMARLFDELVARNPQLLDSTSGRHGLNVFFTRLLFCFFAEDTGIFGDGQFTDAVANLTQVDGSDVHELIGALFIALDTADASGKPAHLASFPYVNGRLFTTEQDQVVPVFTKKARDLLIESGRLRWSEINPDIFGSMFQAVVTPGQRADLGQHYTSVPNILKTIEPLFLDGLKEQLDASFNSVRKLEALHDRIAAIKVFDPACGSGNFLVIAYKELRRLEHAILERLGELRGHEVLFADSRIDIAHFYGIEIDDFAAEVAVLSLWIAKHQMNREAYDKFQLDIPLIPLKQAGRVHRGNAARVDWNEICPNNGTDEIYLISNPPYAGAKVQTKDQKADYPFVFGTRSYSKNLDYISLWFVKGGDYIAGTRAEFAFVTTNSVAQGEHVGLLFPRLFEQGLEIGFAHTSFRWQNNARRAAGVTVAVISLRTLRASAKFIFTNDLRLEAKNINGYLADGSNISISKRSRPAGHLPQMTFGSMPNDGGALVLDFAEAEAMIASSPEAERFLRPFPGSAEWINGIQRMTIWISDSDVQFAARIPSIHERVESTRRHRAASSRPSTKALASTPWRFAERRHRQEYAILVPSVSSERRKYLQAGYIDPGTVASNAALAIYGAEPWVLALVESTLHMAWTRAVGGRLKSDFRYSATIVYNNFPVPSLDNHSKEQMTLTALRILDVREYHSELTLAQLYDPDGMPDDLRLAHQQNDELVDSIYRPGGFETDEERLSHLFALYEETTKEEVK